MFSVSSVYLHSLGAWQPVQAPGGMNNASTQVEVDFLLEDEWTHVPKNSSATYPYNSIGFLMVSVQIPTGLISLMSGD